MIETRIRVYIGMTEVMNDTSCVQVPCVYLLYAASTVIRNTYKLCFFNITVHQLPVLNGAFFYNCMLESTNTPS